MKRQLKNKIRAVLLLTIFSLNVVAGFACSVGLDMGYNSRHHEKDEVSEGKSHKHEHGPSDVKHTHVHSTIVTGAQIKNSNDDCCSDQVNSFVKLDKSIVNNNLLLKAPVFLINSISNLFTITDDSGIAINSRYLFVRRSCSIYDIDIRIAIQSFQI